jgi:hypothetical protein
MYGEVSSSIEGEGLISYSNCNGTVIITLLEGEELSVFQFNLLITGS